MLRVADAAVPAWLMCVPPGLNQARQEGILFNTQAFLPLCLSPTFSDVHPLFPLSLLPFLPAYGLNAQA